MADKPRVYKKSSRRGPKKVKRLIYHEYWEYQDKYTNEYGTKSIVFMQVGSFYEAYSTNSKGYNLDKLSELLNIILTRKNKSKEIVDDTNPYMLGFPDRYLDKYMKILISNGYTVVIFDQHKVINKMGKEDVYRELAGIYSPGTYIENTSPDSNNLICMYISDLRTKTGRLLPCIAIASIDLSTGENTVYESYSTDNDHNYALDEASRFLTVNPPKELIIYKDNTELTDINILSYLELEDKNCTICEGVNKKFKLVSYAKAVLEKVFPDRGMLHPIEYIDLERSPYSLVCYISLLEFAKQHKHDILNNIRKPKIFNNCKNLILGNNASYQLNIIEHNSKNAPNVNYKCLFDVVNKTSTAIGRRFLKYTLNAPYVAHDIIQSRLDCVEALLKDNLWKNAENYLKGIVDIERLSRKLTFNKIQPYELANMYFSIENVIRLSVLIGDREIFKDINIGEDTLCQLRSFVKDIIENFDINIMERLNINDAYDSFFKKGINKEIDNIQKEINITKDLFENITSALSKYVNDRGKAVLSKGNKMTLCNNARDGYYLKLSDKRAESFKKNIKGKKMLKITDNYSIDTSTIEIKVNPKNGQKIFFTDLTKRAREYELLQDKVKEMACEVYTDILKGYNDNYTDAFRETSSFIGLIDYIKSAAKCAKMYNYVKPVIKGDKDDNSFVKCKGLRHPIVERIREDVEYVPHNLNLGKNGKNTLEGMLVYGLNSSGKSTIMKAMGISIIMAQSGMYVPAKSYEFNPYMNLFARISGDDDILKGLSSFALEMTELRAILKRANNKTLIIGDEVCRSTDIISANSLVSTTIEMLSETGATFIFATHLHDIPEMNNIKSLTNVKPYHLTVKYDSDKDRLIFDRKLKEGSGEKVYGIKVAKYLINNEEFISRSQKIADELMDRPEYILNDKKSRYNNNVYVDHCAICKKEVLNNKICKEFFDTHHINFQKDCENGFVKDKPHLPMNSKANLIILCKKCHRAVHNGKFKIKGYIDTSTGRDINIKVNKTKNDKRQKYTEEQIKAIKGLKGKPMKHIKKELKEKYNIEPSTSYIYLLFRSKN